MPDTLKQEIKLFYCYAREDKAMRDELEIHMSGLKRQYHLTNWSDREILPGENWEHAIDQHLSTADIILLLISPHFLASDYCYGKEMQLALARHQIGVCCVIPILLRPTYYWEEAPFSAIQMLPTDAKPLTSWPDRYEAFLDVINGISLSIKAWLISHNNQGNMFKESRSLDNQVIGLTSKAFDIPVDNNPTSYLEESSLTITPKGKQEKFEYKWPEETQIFTSGEWYNVYDQNRNRKVLVARSEREAWGKRRRHVVIFLQSRKSDTGPIYPWVEFLETDDGDYASAIPNPKNPRAKLKDGEPLPKRLSTSRVLRSDQIFKMIQNGPTLRLIVDKNDEISMIQHGLWVAHLRGSTLRKPIKPSSNLEQ